MDKSLRFSNSFSITTEELRFLLSFLDRNSSSQLNDLSPDSDNVAFHILAVLQDARSRGIKCKKREEVEELLLSSSKWLGSARKMLAHDETAYLTIEELKEFIKLGEKSRILDNSTELSSLKQELRRAKSWKQSFDALEQSTNASKMDEINALVRETKDLCVNLSEFVDSVLQSTRMYCLCRQLYFGQMIGCDTCDEWYHFQCVGLTASQAEKAEKYVCIRCSLKSTIQVTACYAAKVANSWMDATRDHFPMLDRNIAIHQKKLAKESFELERWRRTYFSHLEKGNTSSTGEGAEATMSSDLRKDDQGELSVTEKVLKTAEESANQAQLEAMQLEVNKLLLAVNTTKSSIEKLSEAKNYEMTKVHEITDFMFQVLDLLYPENDEQIRVGRPLGPIPISDTFLSVSNPIREHTGELAKEGDVAMEIESDARLPTQLPKFEFGLSMRVLAKHYEILLPSGMQAIVSVAREKGILDVNDVQHIVEAFRWMNWAHLTLHLLRFPPPSPLLRTAIDSAKTIRLFDEKITKLLTTISTKISTWKAKARKLFSHAKKVDESKVNALLLDGNNLPFTSRMKSILKRNHEKGLLKKVPSDGGSGKRQKTTPVGQQPLTPSLSLTAFEACPNSSEDEYRLVEGVLKADSYHETLFSNADNIEVLGVDPNLWYLRYSYPLNLESMLAEEPQKI